MRSVVFEDYILDFSGFIIDSNGNILDNYLDYNNRVYCIVGKDKHYFDELMFNYSKPTFKNIKFLKKKKVWKTYVKSSSPEIINNKEFHHQFEAAKYVNELYKIHNLDRVPNVVPTEDFTVLKYITKKYVEEFNNYIVGSDGSIKNSDNNIEEPIKSGVTNNNYRVVQLTNEEGFTDILHVHEIVANSFIPNPYNLTEIKHIDGDTLNNFRNNLEWINND
jgi:hypothetical protein